MLAIEPRMLRYILRIQGPISIEHVFLWCLFLDSPLTTHHSNMGVYKIAMFDLGTSILGVVYIMDHEVVQCQRAFLHGHNFMVRFLKSAFLKPLGPLTRCKPNVNQDKWPCTKMWMSWKYMSKRAVLGFNYLFHVWPSSPSSLLS